MYYVKQALFGFVYLIFLAIAAFGIMMIENSTVSIILLVLNVALFVFLMFFYFLKEGENAKEAKKTNDMERREIIRTGEDRPLKLQEEYKPWKGFFTGALMAAPLVFFLLIYAIIYLCGGGENNFMGAVANFVYAPFFSFVTVIKASTETLVFGEYFIVLYCVPILSASAGIPYLLGARKQQKKYDKILEKQRMFYGDDYVDGNLEDENSGRNI